MNTHLFSLLLTLVIVLKGCGTNPNRFLTDHAEQDWNGQKEIRIGLKGARPVWSRTAFQNLPKVWEKNIAFGTSDFRSEVFNRYGLFFDPDFSNDGLPVGLIQTTADILPGVRGITATCQLCHTANIDGKVAEGISNPFIDYQRLHEDLSAAVGVSPGGFFKRNIIRNSFTTAAGYMGRLAVFVRDPFPFIDLGKLYGVFADPNENNIYTAQLLHEKPWIYYIRPQPWIGFKFKEASGSGLYLDGGNFSSSSGTHYASHFTLDPMGWDFVLATRRFDRHVPEYFRGLEPPTYPRLDKLDKEQMIRGHSVYERSCSQCHGTFVSAGNRFVLNDYPGRLIDREILQTDTLRIDYRIKFKLPDSIANSFRETGKYIAPPLSGIWARSPYLHNGSVPTLSQLLDSPSRIKKYAILADADTDLNFDHNEVGWRYLDVSKLSGRDLEKLQSENQGLRIFDPEVANGMTNAGHRFGDTLSAKDRADLLTFLKAI